MSWQLDVDKVKVNGSISQLEDICENISQRRTEVSAIEDSFSEGDFYKEYINTVEELEAAMEKIEQAIKGYINVLRYSVDNYETMNTEMATAIDEQ